LGCKPYTFAAPFSLPPLSTDKNFRFSPSSEINPGIFFEIRVDGKVRSYRDDRKIAIDAAVYLKEKFPKSELTVRDKRDGTVVVIGKDNAVKLT
jgi:hypothetical protein